jgi:hypothetical protein
MFLAVFRGRSSGPDGALVGAWLLLIPPVVLAISAAVFLTSQSHAARLACVAFLAFPLLLLVVGPLFDTARKSAVERGSGGGDYFSRSAQRRLANAIYEHDLERVKQLLPAAGDLNKGYKDGQTLFTFGLYITDGSERSLEIIRMMLAAGANPNSPPAIPLQAAIQRSPRLTELLLTAGANPNVPDDSGRPVWWTVLRASSENDLACLRLLLDGGADLQARGGESGPLAWAAEHRCWRALWTLLERGADWKIEQQSGARVYATLAAEKASRERAGTPVPEEIGKALASYEAADQ